VGYVDVGRVTRSRPTCIVKYIEVILAKWNIEWDLSRLLEMLLRPYNKDLNFKVTKESMTKVISK
jgi:hypothetical protein